MNSSISVERVFEGRGTAAVQGCGPSEAWRDTDQALSGEELLIYISGAIALLLP